MLCEISNVDAVRVAGVARWPNASTQLAADGLLLLEDFFDRAGSFDRLGWRDRLSRLDGLRLLNRVRDRFLLLNAKPFSEPEAHILHSLSKPLHRR